MDDIEFEEFRMGHLVRTAELWKRLLEHGASENSPLDFDFHFTTKNKGAADSLQQALNDYAFEVHSKGILNKIYNLSSRSGPITWTEEQLIRWVDFLIKIGDEHGCQFSGCGASSG